MFTRGFSCGAQALRNFLFYHKNRGMVPRGDISNFQEMIDEAKFYVQLFPQKTLNLIKVSPCIVKFGTDHFVVVNEVSQGIVYYLDNGLPYQLPLDDFYGYFKGFVLTEKINDSAQTLKEDECLKIVGHKKGGFARHIVPAVLSIGGQLLGIPAPLTYAATIGSQVGMGEYARRRHPEQLGRPGQFGSIVGDIARGAVTAWAGTSAVKGFKDPTAYGARTTGLGGRIWAGGKSLLGAQPYSTVPAGWTPAGYTPAGTAGYTGTMGVSTMGPAAQSAWLGQMGGGLTYIPGQGWKAPTPGITTTEIAGAGTAGAGSITQQLLGKGLQAYLPSVLAGGVSAGMKLPELPDLEANYREVSQRVLGGSPLSNLATERAMAIMQGQPLTKEDEQAILNIFADRETESIEQINKQYQAVGRLGSEEHQEQVRKGREYWNTQKAYGLYAARKDAQAYQNQILMGAWQYDQNQINQMLDLAQRTGDIEALRWSIRAGDTMGIKSTLDKLAQLLWPQTITARV